MWSNGRVLTDISLLDELEVGDPSRQSRSLEVGLVGGFGLRRPTQRQQFGLPSRSPIDELFKLGPRDLFPCFEQCRDREGPASTRRFS